MSLGRTLRFVGAGKVCCALSETSPSRSSTDCAAHQAAPETKRARSKKLFIRSPVTPRLPALRCLLLLRPGELDDLVNILVVHQSLPSRHVERRSRAFCILQRRHSAVADDGNDFVLGVVVGKMYQRRDLAALRVRIGNATLQFRAMATSASEARKI